MNGEIVTLESGMQSGNQTSRQPLGLPFKIKKPPKALNPARSGFAALCCKSLHRNSPA